MEFYGQVSFMKSGLVYADAISTVSRTYADEVKTFQYGYGLDGVMRSRQDRLFGILNGIDYDKNNPETDKRIVVNYNVDTADKKKLNKTELQKQLGLEVRDVPLVSISFSFSRPKGLDIVSWVAEEMLNRNIQLVILGTERKNVLRTFSEALSGTIRAV